MPAAPAASAAAVDGPPPLVADASLLPDAAILKAWRHSLPPRGRHRQPGPSGAYHVRQSAQQFCGRAIAVGGLLPSAARSQACILATSRAARSTCRMQSAHCAAARNSLGAAPTFKSLRQGCAVTPASGSRKPFPPKQALAKVFASISRHLANTQPSAPTPSLEKNPLGAPPGTGGLCGGFYRGVAACGPKVPCAGLRFVGAASGRSTQAVGSTTLGTCSALPRMLAQAAYLCAAESPAAPWRAECFC